MCNRKSTHTHTHISITNIECQNNVNICLSVWYGVYYSSVPRQHDSVT